MVAACAVIASLVGFGVSSTHTKQYEASTSIQLQETDLVQLFLQDTIQVSDTDPARRAATNQELISLPSVRVATSRRLGGRVSPAALKAGTTVANSQDTDIFTVTVRNPSPQLAAAAANATVAAFIQSRIDATRASLNKARAQVTAQYNALSPADKASLTGQGLQQRLRQVGVVGALANGGVDVVQTATPPKEAVAPRPKRTAVLALIAGLMLGLVIALLRARFDERIRDADELQGLWNLPVVGLLPETRDLDGAGRSLPNGPALEAFALTRTNLRYLHVGGDFKTLVVTSAVEGEGKSTVVWNLAVAAALAETRVLVVEADLRRPVLSQRLGLTGRTGLSEVLAGIATVDESVTAVAITDESRGSGVSIDVLPAGLIPPSPIALLERHGTKAILDALKAKYDLVLIDTPPATIVADALVLLEQADAAVIVSRLGRVTRSSVARMRDQFAAVDAPVLGQIVNGGASAKAYGYTAYTSASARVKPASL